MQPLAADPLTGLSVDSSAFRQRAPRVQLSDDPDTATIETVQEMVRQIDQAAADPLVQRIARAAVHHFRGGPRWVFTPWSDLDPITTPETPSGTRAQILADSCWWWCKHFLKFKHHGRMFEVWSSDLGNPETKLQLLIAPDVLVRMERMEGDCAIYTMMLCAMLKALGVPYQIFTLAVNPSQPEIFSHVCAGAVLPQTVEWLDASHGSYPGWRVPDDDISRMWVFDQIGTLVTNRPRGFSGLHAYRAGRVFRGVGMGDVCNFTDADYDPVACEARTGVQSPPAPGSSSTVDLTALYPGGVDPTWGAVPTTVSGQPGYSAPSQNSAQWGIFASQLAKMGFTLAQINAIQPGTVVSANGAILRQNPGYAVPFQGTQLSAALGGSSSTFMIVGLGLVALLVLPSLMRGGK